MENISKKEFWIGIGIALLALAIGLLIEPTIKDKMMAEIRLYQDALRVNDDPNMFSYAQKTNIGNVLAVGNFEALQPQIVPELQNNYAFIEKIQEHYTMHTRLVSHESCSGSGSSYHCSTYYTTEVYYSWDIVQRWDFSTSQYNFLSVVFSQQQLSIPAGEHLRLSDQTMNSQYKGYYNDWYLYPYKSVFGPTGDDRFYFLVVPTKFAGTLFINFSNDKFYNPINKNSLLDVYVSKTPDQVIQDKKNELVVFDISYYVVIVLVVAGLWYLLSYSQLDIE